MINLASSAGALPRRARASTAEAEVAVFLRGVLGGVGNSVDLGVVVVLEDQVASLVPELDTVAVERNQRRIARAQSSC